MLRPAFILLLCGMMACIACRAQKETKVGLVLGWEHAYKDWGALKGFVVTHRIDKRRGVESGIQWRTPLLRFQERFLFVFGDETYTVRVREKYASIPVLYTFYSPAMQVSAGPTIDFYVGYKARVYDNDQQVKRLTYTTYHKATTLGLGVLLKLSKDISLGKQTVLTPEFRVNPVFQLDITYVGVGLQAKYRLAR